MNRRTWMKRAAVLTGGAAVSAALPAGLKRATAQSRSASNGSVTWIATTETSPWQTRPLRAAGWRWDTLDVAIELESGGLENAAPAIVGFGACFNELGWTSLQTLRAEDQEAIFKELFSPGVGANFNVCRMPVGANDFSRGWYSYDEHAEDFSLEHFSIANDLETLVPFIKSAKKYNPALELWASPWSPPSWMKRNQHYAAAMQQEGRPTQRIEAGAGG